MIRLPPRSTRTDTLFPTRRSSDLEQAAAAALREQLKSCGKWPAKPDLAEWFGEKGSDRSEEHTSELQSLMRISYAVFCLKKKQHIHNLITIAPIHTIITINSSHTTTNIHTHSCIQPTRRHT